MDTFVGEKRMCATRSIKLHAPTSSTQKLKLMGRGGQFTYIPTIFCWTKLHLDGNHLLVLHDDDHSFRTFVFRASYLFQRIAASVQSV